MKIGITLPPCHQVMCGTHKTRRGSEQKTSSNSPTLPKCKSETAIHCSLIFPVASESTSKRESACSSYSVRLGRSIRIRPVVRPYNTRLKRHGSAPRCWLVEPCGNVCGVFQHTEHLRAVVRPGAFGSGSGGPGYLQRVLDTAL